MSTIEGLTQAVATASGITTRYYTGGDGPTVVFLHGWGLAGTPLYFNALSRLTHSGYRVFAPMMPGFGSDALPVARFTLSGFAQWVADFIKSLPVTGKVVLAGYSFGGGVAIRTAHDHPELVDRLVLLNSIGGATWTNRQGHNLHLRHRSLWDWGRGMGGDVTDDNHLVHLLPSICTKGVAHLLRRPDVVWRSGHLARTSDLTAELSVLRTRQVPLAIVWSRQDKVIPHTTINSLRHAAGDHMWVTVEGSHCWLNGNQTGFCDIMRTILQAPQTAFRVAFDQLTNAAAA